MQVIFIFVNAIQRSNKTLMSFNVFQTEMSIEDRNKSCGSMWESEKKIAHPRCGECFSNKGGIFYSYYLFFLYLPPFLILDQYKYIYIFLFTQLLCYLN